MARMRVQMRSRQVEVGGSDAREAGVGVRDDAGDSFLRFGKLQGRTQDGGDP